MQRLVEDEGRVLDIDRQLNAAQAALGELRASVDPIPARLGAFERAHTELAAASARADAELQRALTETHMRIERTDTRVMEHETSVGAKLTGQEKVIASVDLRTQDVARQVLHICTSFPCPVVVVRIPPNMHAISWRALRVVAVWSGQASRVQVVKVESQLEPLRALCRQLQQEIELLGSRKIDPNLAQRIEQVRYPDRS